MPHMDYCNIIYYGEMWIAEGTTPTSITDADTWYPIRNGYASGLLKGISFDPVEDCLCVHNAGIYQVTCQLSYTASANKQYHFGIGINGIVPERKLRASSASRSSGNEISAPMMAVVEFQGMEKLDLRVSSTTAGNEVIVVHANLSVHSI